MRTLICDTRQQKGKHKNKEAYFEKMGIPMLRSKLPAGDYAFMDNMTVVCDSKQNLQEVVNNLTQDHERFRREADLCLEHGITLYVLVEEPGMHCLEDVKNWENPRLHRYNKINYMHNIGKWASVPLPKGKPTSNITLYKIMWTMAERHGVHWEFCDPKDAGRRIIELLGGVDIGNQD